MEIYDRDEEVVNKISMEISRNLVDFLSGEINLNKVNYEKSITLNILIHSICRAYMTTIMNVHDLVGQTPMELLNDIHKNLFIPNIKTFMMRQKNNEKI